MMAEIAEILGIKEDQVYYEELHEKIKKAFQMWFLREDDIVTPDFQGALVIALHFGLLPGETVEKNVQHLIGKIRENNGCLDTGFLSVPYLLDALSEHGEIEKAYDLLFQDKCPSWLYEVKMGATTIWESWHAIDENGVPNSCSYNHYAFGSVGDWMYRNIGGLKAEKPGYKEFIVKPQMDKRIDWAQVSYDSRYGKIGVHWRKEKKGFRMELEVPVNTTCTVIMPNGEQKKYGSGIYNIVG